MTNIIGANTASTSTTALFGLGDVYTDHAGCQWVYVKSTAAISQYDAVTFDETYSGTVAPVTTSNASRDDKLGVAAVAFTSGDYGWLQIYGPCVVNVAAACAPNAELTMTTVAGVLDDATTASLKVADAIAQTATSVSGASSKAGILNFPKVGRTL